MTSKRQNGGDSWGTLHGRPMEEWAFCYDRHEEITRYIRMRDVHYHPMVTHVFCLLLFQMPYTIQFNIEYVSQNMCTDFFTLTLANYFRLNNFLYKSPPNYSCHFYLLTSSQIRSIPMNFFKPL